jgi:DNA-binding GntR family transcriptional regulator
MTERPEPLATIAFEELDSSLLLSEAVFRSLRAALHSGRLQPGDRLREDEVANQMGVSRTPVRDAFGRLIARRLLEPAGGKGLIVRSLTLGEVRELYSMREILEGAAAGLAAQHASKTEIDVLHDVEAQIQSSAPDSDTIVAANALLHETIIHAARNRYLDHALEDLRDSIALLGGKNTYIVPGRPETSAMEHRQMIAAIAARDGEAAERAAKEHIRSALRARLQIVQQARTGG